MKKSLIALAVLAASGASFAQSSVTLWGVADVWFGSYENAAAGEARKTKLDAGGVSHNRFGFKGSEDLGGGLKAIFSLEQGFSLDTGANDYSTQAFARQSYVGFAGNFGEVRLGKSFTPFDDVNGASNAAFDSALSPLAGIGNVTYTGNPANGFYYATPDIGGVTAAISYNLDEKTSYVAAVDGQTPAAGLQVTSFNIGYGAGPVAVGLAYSSEKKYQSTTDKFTRLNGAYDLGVAKLLANYGRADKAGTVSTEWQIGADVPLSSALTLSGGYAQAKTGSTTNNGFGLAASYSLSKRTSIYGGLRRDGGDVADAKLYAIGVRHAF